MPNIQTESGTTLQKSMLVLGGLLDNDRPMNLSGISRHTDIPRQTVYRIARQLEDAGLIRREPGSDGYTVGSALLDISINTLHLANHSLPMRGVLRNLVEAIGETCNVGILDRDQVVYIERVECDWPLRFQFGPGSRVSVHATAIGKLLLAHLPNRTRMRILTSQNLTRYTDNTLVDLKQFDVQFRKIRRQGFATNNQENLQGIVALAVPIFDAREKVVAGLSIHAPRARMEMSELETCLPELRAAANIISRGILDLLKSEDKQSPAPDMETSLTGEDK